MSEYICAFTGEEVDEDEVDFESDDSLPEGWTRITIERRRINDKWAAIQQTKYALVEAAMQQIPEEHRDTNRPLLAIQIEAQFAFLESTVQKYDNEAEVVYVSPVEGSPAVLTAYNGVREALGLEVLTDQE